MTGDAAMPCYCHSEEIVPYCPQHTSLPGEVSTSEWLGQRCRMRYGLGTIATDWSDKGLFGVTDDVGYWWLCDEDEVRCAECGVPLYLGHEPECGGGQDV